MNYTQFYETHCHTPLCLHAQGEPEEYAAQALALGMRGITITCHGPLPDGISSHVRMADTQWQEYIGMVAQAKATYEGKLDVRLGLESDYLPGLEPWIEKLHQRADFDYILGSVHPQLAEYKHRYHTSDWPAFHRTYFQHLAEAAETGHFDCISHPDLVKNLGSKEYSLSALMPDILRTLDRIAATGVAMELNTSGIHKKVPEMNPSPTILVAILERGIPVVIGSDAHSPQRVGEGYQEAVDLLVSLGFQEVRYYLHRQPVTIPIIGLANTALASK